MVPAFLNGPRTNSRPPYDFSLFDFRIQGPWIEKKMPSLFQVLETRLWESILWTRQRILAGNEKPEVLLKLVLDSIEDGYNRAITEEMRSIQNIFLNPLNFGSPKLITNADSCFAFLNQMLLQGRENDLLAVKNHKLEYTKLSNKRIISKNFFIRQAVTGAIIQIEVSQAFADLIKSPTYKNHFIKRHAHLTEELKYELQQFVESYKTNSNFDVKQAEEFLKKLTEAEKQADWEYLTTPSSKNGSYARLENICNEVLRLGDSYGNNGQILDLTIGSAETLATRANKPKNFNIEESLISKEKNLFPTLSNLSPTEYRKLIKQQTSPYAKKLLTQSFPKNVTQNQYNSEKRDFNRNFENEDSITFDFYEPNDSKKTLVQKPLQKNTITQNKIEEKVNTDEWPIEEEVNTDEWPKVPARKTSDDERLKRLTTTFPNVPERKTSDEERLERLQAKKKDGTESDTFK